MNFQLIAHCFTDVLAKDTLKNVGYWMGGTDFYHAGNWVWTDGSPGQNISIINFRSIICVFLFHWPPKGSLIDLLWISVTTDLLSRDYKNLVSCFTDWHEGEPFGSWNGKNEDCLAVIFYNSNIIHYKMFLFEIFNSIYPFKLQLFYFNNAYFNSGGEVRIGSGMM